MRVPDVPSDGQLDGTPHEAASGVTSEPAVAPQTAPEADDTGARRRRRRARAGRHVSRSVKIIIFLFVLNNLVIPQIGGARHAAEKLSEVNPAMLVAGLLLQFASLACYAMLTRAALPKPQPHLHEQVRMQLATKAVTNTVPGGTAAGSVTSTASIAAMGAKRMTLNPR